MKTASQQASKPTCQRDRHAARRPPSGDVHPRCQEHLKLRRTICRGLARELCRTSGGRRGLMSVCCHWLRRGASMLFFGILLHRFVSCACGHRIRQRCGSSRFFRKKLYKLHQIPSSECQHLLVEVCSPGISLCGAGWEATGRVDSLYARGSN